MSKIDDGGPAYPRVHPTPEGGTMYFRGMSLRDWFAAQALSGIMGPNYDWFTSGSGVRTHEAAYFAYSLADAMLQARKEKEE